MAHLLIEIHHIFIVNFVIVLDVARIPLANEQCATCGKRFRNKFRLKLHLFFHLRGYKRYQCQFGNCSFSTNEKRSLHAHAFSQHFQQVCETYMRDNVQKHVLPVLPQDNVNLNLNNNEIDLHGE